MDFGYDMRVQNGDVDDGMQLATFPPAMEFGTLVRQQLPQEALYNPGPTPQDSTTDMFGAPSGELIIGAHDSKIHDPSYTPIVHSLLIEDLSGKGKFYPKGQLVSILRKKDKDPVSRRRLMKRQQEDATPCLFNKPGPETNPKSILQGIYPLSEGVIFPKTSNKERVAITVHDHAEIITCDPRTVRDLARDADIKIIENQPYYAQGSNFHANVNSSLWVAIGQNKHTDELMYIPVVNPIAENLDYLNHMGTLKQAYTPDDDTWIISFAPL